MKRLVLALLTVAVALSAWGFAMFSEGRAQRAVRFFESLKHTKGRFYGEPFTLLDWERTIVRDVYGTLKADNSRQYKYVWVEIPKKNGKSEFAAGAGLFQTFADGERNGEVYGCAADKGQASIVFDVAVDMIDQVPALKKRAKITGSQKKITDRKTGTFYKVVSAEAYTKHGLNLSACIFDELHAQPNRDLWDVMTFGAGDARAQPIWWVITTAGDDPDRVSVGWEQHEYAAKLLAGEIIDPTWYPVIYAYDPEDKKTEDIYDESNWAKANPSLGHTITLEGVREAAAKAKIKPADERLFRWLRLNQWITTKLTAWQPITLFDETVGEWTREDLAGRECYLGLDLSSTTDLTAAALVFPPQSDQEDWRVIWHCWIPEANMQERIRKDHVPYGTWAADGWVTVTEGNVIDYTKVEADVLALREKYRVKEIDADPALATMLLQRFMDASFDVWPIKPTFVVLTDPLNQTEVLLKEHKLTHENNPVARWCFGNTSVAKNGQGLIKYVKETRGTSVIRTKRIDLVAAWITAMTRAITFEGAASVYETRGLLIL